jgi:hypothetical protein
LDHRRKFGLNRLFHPTQSNGGTDRGLLAKVPLYAEVNRQNHGDNGYGAQHQNRKENFNYHRKSGYQNETGAVFNFRIAERQGLSERCQVIPGFLALKRQAWMCSAVGVKGPNCAEHIPRACR